MEDISGTQRRTLFRHPLAAVGGALATAGLFLFLILLLYDITSGEENPYRSLLTFVVAPSVMVIGTVLFLVSVWIQVRTARKQGEAVRFSLSLDTTDPRYVRNLWVFLVLSAIFVFLTAYGGTRVYEATDSVAFCGETCHDVMDPQYVTYHHSPHARISCAECHIGPGASFWVRSKIDGIRQVIATIRNTYSRPIPTPVHNLRPAQETCETCHWPQQFYGDKFVTHTYYRTDEANSPWTISMRVRIGGGNPRTGSPEGIHWHMLTENVIEYVATNPKRQTISWTRVITPTGDTTTYVNQDVDSPDTVIGSTAMVRRFDCMDCHNRPSHTFQPPAVAINQALKSGQLSGKLPYIRLKAVELLNAEYETKQEALATIASGIKDYYLEDYPSMAPEIRPEMEEAIPILQEIFEDNFFPEMKTDYRVRENNLSHFVNDGCFRCHNESMVNREGNSMATACTTCHLIVAQGPSEEYGVLEANLTGLEFRHPEDIDEAWKEMKCTDCHDPASGY
ncbi:MAG: NapC/NirT family cytochrome c [bacterium]